MKVSNIFVIDEISNEDTRFLKVEIDVLHTGLNFNNSVFDKDVVNENIESIKNTPIVGYIENTCDDKDFEGHEYKLSRTKDGVTYVYNGSAYGVIPENCNPRWVTKLCDDGEEREFLRVDGILWRKFEDSSEIFVRDIVKSQSMELELGSIDGYEDEDGIYHFTKFTFDGCCILGDDKEPAMINSKIELNYTINDFVKSVQSELINKYQTYTKLISEKNNCKGGVCEMPDNKDFSLSINQRLDDIRNAVYNQETITDEYGYTYPRYYVSDVQDNEVIVTDMKDYNLYGVSFTENGDSVELDFAGCKRKKVTYEDYSDGDNQPETTLTSFSEVVSNFANYYQDKIKEFETSLSDITSQKDEISNNYNSVKEKLDEIEPKYNDFVKAEQQRIDDEIKAEKDNTLLEFEKQLSDMKEFEEIKNNKDELTVDEIVNKCSVLYYKKNSKNNFSKQDTTSSIGIPDIKDDIVEDNVYETSRYGNIRINK